MRRKSLPFTLENDCTIGEWMRQEREQLTTGSTLRTQIIPGRGRTHCRNTMTKAKKRLQRIKLFGIDIPYSQWGTTKEAQTQVQNLEEVFYNGHRFHLTFS